MLEDKNTQRTSLEALGEFALIKHLTQHFELMQESSLKGIGDDAAVLDFKGMKTVVSTDLLVEGVHFDLSYMPLKHLGYKSVMVNLSDIYAMNAQATQITVSIAVSNRFGLEALEEFYAGVAMACKLYQVDLVGEILPHLPKECLSVLPQSEWLMRMILCTEVVPSRTTFLWLAGTWEHPIWDFKCWNGRKRFLK